MIKVSRRTLMTGAAGVALGAAAALPAFGAERNVFRIYMVTLRGWTDTDDGFRDYFETRRIPVQLIHRDVNRDMSKLAGIIAEIKQAKPHLVYVWGTGISIGVIGKHNAIDPAKHITDIPTVFTNVSSPIGSGLVKDLEPTGRNVTGSTFLVPMTAQISAMTSYRPVNRLGVIFNPDEQNSVETVDELRERTQVMGIKLFERPIPIVDGEPDKTTLRGLVESLVPEKIDFLYIPPDSFLSKHARDFTHAALEHRLPTFAAAEGTLKDSYALMGLISRYYNIGKLAGYQAERILVNRIAPGAMPIEGLTRYSLIINKEVAKELDLVPPMLMLRFAELS